MRGDCLHSGENGVCRSILTSRYVLDYQENVALGGQGPHTLYDRDQGTGIDQE